MTKQGILGLAACGMMLAMLSGCGADYVVKPSGTNENAVNGTFVVPERYKKGNIDVQNDIEQTESSDNATEVLSDAESAEKRKVAFEDIFNSETLYMSMDRMRSYGESSEEAKMIAAYADNKAYFAMYNSNDVIVQEVLSEGDTAWLIDRELSKRLETEKSTYKYCDMQTLRDMFVLTDTEYVKTFEDSIEGKTLLCDEYSSGDTVIRYYYDTAENLILLRVNTDNDEIITLFSELTTYISEDFWEMGLDDYVTEQLIN